VTAAGVEAWALCLLLWFRRHRVGDQGHSLPSPGPPASLSLFARQTACGFAWEGGIESLLGKEAGTLPDPGFTHGAIGRRECEWGWLRNR
jgi:hypothetical protein